LLQHGSLPIESHADLLFSLLRFSSEMYRQKARSVFNKRMLTLGEVIGKDIDVQDLIESLREGFAHALGIRFYEDSLTEEEIRRSQELASVKYDTHQWNHRS